MSGTPDIGIGIMGRSITLQPGVIVKTASYAAATSLGWACAKWKARSHCASRRFAEAAPAPLAGKRQLRGRNTKPCVCLFAFFATPSDQAERLFHLAFNGCWSEGRQTLGHTCCGGKKCESKLEHGGSPWLMRRSCPVLVRWDVRRSTGPIRSKSRSGKFGRVMRDLPPCAAWGGS
jgi:hypothetical protein